MRKFKANILIVDDSQSDIELIIRAFRSCGVGERIDSVNSGLETIDYLMGEGKYSDRKIFPYPSFIISDLKMSNGSGFSVLDHLKANPAWAVIPTIILSGSSDPDDVRTAYMLGASSFHVKPDNFGGLRSLIQIIYDYWINCLMPDTDETGKQVITLSESKLGEMYPQPIQIQQVRIIQ